MTLSMHITSTSLHQRLLLYLLLQTSEPHSHSAPKRHIIFSVTPGRPRLAGLGHGLPLAPGPLREVQGTPQQRRQQPAASARRVAREGNEGRHRQRRSALLAVFAVAARPKGLGAAAHGLLALGSALGAGPWGSQEVLERQRTGEKGGCGHNSFRNGPKSEII